MRKLAASKPVHAAAGVGVLASETLRELPARLAKWRDDASASTLSSRANGYVTHGPHAGVEPSTTSWPSAGQKALNGRSTGHAKAALNGSREPEPAPGPPSPDHVNRGIQRSPEGPDLRFRARSRSRRGPPGRIARTGTGLSPHPARHRGPGWNPPVSGALRSLLAAGRLANGRSAVSRAHMAPGPDNLGGVFSAAEL